MNDREIATLIWLGVFLVGALSIRDVREGLGGVFASLLRLAPPILAMLAWIGGLIYLGERYGLWKPALIYDSVVWSTTAAVLFGGAIGVFNKGKSVKRLYLKVLGASLLLEFYVNLYTLPLIPELMLIPWVAVWTMMAVYATDKEEFRPAKKVADRLLTITGLALIAFVAVELITGWGAINWGLTWRKLVLPVWLTLGMLPFVLILGFYASYNGVFSRVRWATENRRERMISRLALITRLHARAREVHAFDFMWSRRLAEASSSLASARAVVAGFRDREPEPEEPEEELEEAA